MKTLKFQDTVNLPNDDPRQTRMKAKRMQTHSMSRPRGIFNQSESDLESCTEHTDDNYWDFNRQEISTHRPE